MCVGIFPTPPSNFLTPAGCPTIQIKSGDLADWKLSPTSLPPATHIHTTQMWITTSSPFPLPRGHGWNWKFQHSNSVGSAGNQPPQYLGDFQKSPHWHKLGCGGKGLVMKNKTPSSPLWLRSDFRTWGQGTKYYNKRCSHGCPHSGNSKDFRSSLPEMGMKIKYVFLIINHNITVYPHPQGGRGARGDLINRAYVLKSQVQCSGSTKISSKRAPKRRPFPISALCISSTWLLLNSILL